MNLHVVEHTVCMDDALHCLPAEGQLSFFNNLPAFKSIPFVGLAKVAAVEELYLRRNLPPTNNLRGYTLVNFHKLLPKNLIIPSFY